MKKFEQQNDVAMGIGTAAKPIKCDGNHGAPVCADKECWLRDPPLTEPPPPPPEQRTALVPVDDLINSPLIPLADGKVPIRRMATSLNPRVQAEGILAYRAQQDNDVAGDDWVNQVIEVEHWLMHDYVKEDEKTGEVFDRVRTVLISPDGKRYGFSSIGIANSVRAICQFVRPAPWRPAIKVKLIAKRSSNERRFFTLDLIG